MKYACENKKNKEPLRSECWVVLILNKWKNLFRTNLCKATIGLFVKSTQYLRLLKLVNQLIFKAYKLWYRCINFVKHVKHLHRYFYIICLSFIFKFQIFVIPVFSKFHRCSISDIIRKIVYFNFLRKINKIQIGHF